jgi:hypothetical protein
LNQKEDSECQIISVSESFELNQANDSNSNSLIDENMDVFYNSYHKSRSSSSDFEFHLFSSSSSSAFSSVSNQSDLQTEQSSVVNQNKHLHSSDSINTIRERNNQIIEDFFAKASEALNNKFDIYKKQLVKTLESLEKSGPCRYYNSKKRKRFEELVSFNSETNLIKLDNSIAENCDQTNRDEVEIDNIKSKMIFEQEKPHSKPLPLNCLLNIESSRVESDMISVTLMWNLINEVTKEIVDPNDKILDMIEEYELYCCKQKKPQNFTELFRCNMHKREWVLVGAIKPCDLPIKCVLGDLSSGFEYSFAIKIRDKNNNMSEFCKEVKISF